jgi:carboxyl-terminal processing protease
MVGHNYLLDPANQIHGIYKKMKRRLILLVALISLGSLACRTVTQVILPPTPTLTATPTATATATPTITPTATVTPTYTPSPTATVTPTRTATPTTRPSPAAFHFRIFDELWQVVNDEYVDASHNGLDWEAVKEEYLSIIRAGLTDQDFYMTLQEMIASLGDQHSVYFSPEEAQAEEAEFSGERNYVGIGVYTIPITETGTVTVILVFPGSPAEEAGIKMHDNILAVDGQPVLDDTGQRRNLLRGPEGTTINVTVQTPGEAPRDVQITRRAVTGSLPVPYSVLTSPQGQRIGYILIPSFNDSSVDGQIGNALRGMTQYGELDGLILDNRHNGGGASTVFENTLGYFANGALGRFVNRQNSSSLVIPARDIAGSQRLPLVVLVGKGTASFGEIFSGILKDVGRAYLIGETTDGNVEILYVYKFFDGSMAWIAHDTFEPPKSKDVKWEETGIVPDQTVLSNWYEVTTETDPAILAALEHLDSPR